MLPADATPLAAIADRAQRLDSPPAVAMEVLRLADQPYVDARALCQCLESDPALASKVLRVVNSSLYGLPQEVASLGQAVALLGVKPLKLLVLGFSVPDRLVGSLKGELLRRYWTETLTVAAAARRFAELGWGRLGDEALAAGLMQRVGQLALASELGEDYATLVDKATKGGEAALERAEIDALGFGHRTLSAELVRRWRLPPQLAMAIDWQAHDGGGSALAGDADCLAKALRLANLLGRLVLSRELTVLPKLLEEGQRYCGLTKRQLNSLVAALGQSVVPLAEAVATPLDPSIDYRQPLVEAQARLALLSEEGAVRMLGDARSTGEIDADELLCRELLLETRRLSAAMRVLLAGGLEPRTDTPHDATATRHAAKPVSAPIATSVRHGITAKTDQLVEACREALQPLSLALVHLSGEEASADAVALRQWLAESAWGTDFARCVWAPMERNRAAVWFPGLERTEAARLWSKVTGPLLSKTGLALDVGLAGASRPSRGFNSREMVSAAERCLAGAVAASGPTVKSIEVY